MPRFSRHYFAAMPDAPIDAPDTIIFHEIIDYFFHYEHFFVHDAFSSSYSSPFY